MQAAKDLVAGPLDSVFDRTSDGTKEIADAVAAVGRDQIRIRQFDDVRFGRVRVQYWATPDQLGLAEVLEVLSSAEKDGARQPGIRAGGLVGRDFSIHSPRANAASVIDEATANGVQFEIVQLFVLAIAMLGHVCLPLSKEGPSLLIWWSQK